MSEFLECQDPEFSRSVAAELTLAAFAGYAPPDHLLEVRYKTTRGWRQEFFPVRELAACQQFIDEMAGYGDVYTAALPRIRRGGRADDTGQAFIAWVDHDGDDGLEALLSADPAPSIVLSTGTGRHALGIWQLNRGVNDIRPINQKLAHALGGDLNACDRARVLRVPGTFNYKQTPAKPVCCIRLEPTSFSVERLVGYLPAPPTLKPPGISRTLESGDVLGDIPATDYVPALSGTELGRDGKITCPFHDDRTPSLHAYPGDRGWACFGCGRGGTIIDFGAALYGLEPRGSGYHEIRRRVAADLLGTVAA